MAKNIICFGEALIDFLNVGSQDLQGVPINRFDQYPGGAPANVAVALAKLGAPVQFLGQVGQDAFGNFLIDCLNTYGVDTRLTLQHPSAPTALAFVFLDASGDRSFSFYRDASADLLLTPAQCPATLFEGCGIFHFCSNTLTDESITKTTEAALANARAQGAVVSFDVNLRHNLWAKGAADIARVNRLVHAAEVVKFSRDELDYLAGSGNASSYLQACFAAGVKLVLVTDGGQPVHAYTAQFDVVAGIPDVDVVDTTAGGDGFTGGMLCAVNALGLSALTADADLLTRAVGFAVSCGAVAVSRPGAFPALPTLDDVKPFWN
ncbi:carbohydrate kinase [Simiduia sp. 21SJ11W-1]|uniref:carbohydrate kinase family protein n=1 Tax=Simiduia sp. 21SJ11W-1 TaxID=2909669 RepID=UPI0020A18522|nr:carbohydrate kinase [Simiduia sp. 21SJ11W-1]UTA48316.1 carbohydrate kinase [Simiduia sp. 21SJ11W-1]